MNINFITNWILFSEYTVDKSDKMLFANQTNKYLTINKNNRNDSLAQYVYSSPCLQTKDIHNEIINLITNAKHSIKITTPYFLITSELITTILIARRKNIPIEIIVPGRRDNKDFIIPMNRSHYKKMLDMGVSIYEYDGFIHSKLLIVDDYCLITSSNFDYRSFFSTFEGGVLVHSKNILKELTSIFEDDKQNSKNITKEFIKTYDSLWFKIQCLAVNIIKPLF
jgi:cardiolipin synthase